MLPILQNKPKTHILAVIDLSELITAQQELLEASKTRQSQPDIYEAVKSKLRQWKLTDSQIADIENSGKVRDNFEILSNTNGVIIHLWVKMVIRPTKGRLFRGIV